MDDQHDQRPGLPQPGRLACSTHLGTCRTRASWPSGAAGRSGASCGCGGCLGRTGHSSRKSNVSPWLPAPGAATACEVRVLGQSVEGTECPGGRTGARPVPGEEGSQRPGRNHAGRYSEPETPHSGAVVDNSFFFHSIVFFRFCYFFGPAAQHGISVPRPGIETAPPALEAWSLNCWTAREAPLLTVLMPSFYPRATVGEAGGHQGVSMLPGGSHLQPGWRTATCPPLDSPPQAPPHLSSPSQLCSFHLCSNTTFSVISRDYFIENGRTLGWGFPIPCSTLPPLKRHYLLCLLCCFFYGNIHACGLGYFCFVCCCSPQRGA